MKKSLTLAAWLAGSLLPAATRAQDAPPLDAYGSLFRSIAGDGLEKNHRIGVLGWVDATAITASSTGADGALGNGAFFSGEEGLNLNQLGLVFCRGISCPGPLAGRPQGVIARVGPFPGPRGEQVEFGFNITATYGRDSDFFRTAGFDDFTSDLDDDNKLAFPQAYAEVYLPLLGGTTVLAGNFLSPVSGKEIGLPFTPPNWFSTHTYSLQHGPGTHTGVLISSRLPTREGAGLWGFELGAVTGWSTVEDSRPTLIGALRWRSADFRTWVDFEAVYGDGEGDAYGPSRGGSAYIALSSTGERLDRAAAYLTVGHQVNPDLSLAFEASYGFQEGGDIPAPGAITQKSEWYGLNAQARYQLADNLHLNGRAEWFRDDSAANILWAANGATGGNVYAVTAGLEWQATPALRIRPELRYDTYDGGGTLFGGGRNDQFTALLNATLRF
ncbi:porin [Leisingera sp. S132]|uniref:porin n=1 Tax=Leisingera sp. S132 TaxID=2867016 RepID=UPI0021A3333B|nr:porin [Leisingera sp. S132]UWQ78666.1 porin [Leisingera sp. S132]